MCLTLLGMPYAKTHERRRQFSWQFKKKRESKRTGVTLIPWYQSGVKIVLSFTFKETNVEIYRINDSKYSVQLHLIKNVSSHFRPDALWLTAFYYANPSFLMGVQYFVYVFLICAHFFPPGKQLGLKTRSGYNLSLPLCVLKHVKLSSFNL